MKYSHIFLLVYLSAIATLFSPHTHASDFDSLTIMTEDFPPFNFTENGQAAGKTVDLLMKASAAVGNPITKEKISVITWARAYKTVLSEPKHMLFSMTRTAERESLFK